MIEITIRRTVTVEFEETKNMVTKKTPTEHTHQGQYDSRPQPLYIEESQPVTVKATRSETVTLLNQQIQDDDAFNLTSVIAAVNNMLIPPPPGSFNCDHGMGSAWNAIGDGKKCCELCRLVMPL